MERKLRKDSGWKAEGKGSQRFIDQGINAVIVKRYKAENGEGTIKKTNKDTSERET